jgi:hypothetical protein
MKIALFISLLFVSSVSALGQSSILPEAPETHAGTPKAFWALTGAYTASIIADGITTQHNLANGCVETWSAPLYGRRPSNLRFYTTSFAIEAGAVLTGRRLLHSHSRLLRSVAWAMLSTDTEEHLRGAIHNANFASVCAQAASGPPTLTVTMNQ